MKINEVTNNKRLDEFWPQLAAGVAAVGKVGSKLFKKAPDLANKKGITKGDSRAVINRKSSTEFDDIPLPQKVTGKVYGDPKLGNTERWRKDSNLHIQKMVGNVQPGTGKAINRINHFPKK